MATHTLRHQCGNPLIRPPRCARWRPNGGQGCTGSVAPALARDPGREASGSGCCGAVMGFAVSMPWRGFRIDCHSYWWRSVWVSVAGGGGVQLLVVMASSVLLKYQTVVRARSGHLRIRGWKAFSLLRFFVAVGQRNEVPPRTVANGAKKISQDRTREDLKSNNPASTPTTKNTVPSASAKPVK